MMRYTKASPSDAVTLRERENLAVAYEAACEGMVLLKNDGALPFHTKRVALYGAGASMTIKGGTGSGEVNERHSVTILEGMKDRGFEIASERWIRDYEQGFLEAKAAYKIEKRRRLNPFKLNSIMQMLFDNFRFPSGRPITGADVAESDTDACVYVLSRQAGEGGDRRAEKGDMLLTDEELEHIRFCAGHYSRFVLAINSGSAIDMAFAEEIPGINAIVYICQPGTEGGHAFADILSGAVSPSGKLADTWAKRYSDIPFAGEYSYLNGDLQNEYYREGICVGYRYFDTFAVQPAYPFGFGLSYADFALRPLDVTVSGTKVVLSAAVRNTGAKFSGMEVAQLYVSPPAGKLPREYQILAAFEKTKNLAPGEEQVLELVFDMGDIAAYRESDAAFVLEPGEYILRLGKSSRDTLPAAVIALDGEGVVSRHRHICPVQKPFDELRMPERACGDIPGNVPRVSVSAGDFAAAKFDYDDPKPCRDERARAFVRSLSPAEMAEIVVGVGMFGGEKRFDLPGSVGNTTSKFWDRGLVNVALCDGPAGLRVQKRSTIDKNGRTKPVDLAMSVFEAMPGFIKRFMVGDPRKHPVVYQYTTAFPVATALAQTWNRDLMNRVGEAVYREMREYGCTYWLAPAVNIHRNPLCGRNFEYFSEDPLLAGRMAAAIIRGVQQQEGFYVTVKHFACNNQEDNRNYMSSNLSERALREIYLRPFEIAVREGGAKGIMTSYNRVNGVYTANSHDLCTKVLRDEWGFDGVVMTDWFATNRGQSDSALCMAAGNDLIMPGRRMCKKAILKGIQSGRITEDDLRRSCERVVGAVMNSDIRKQYIK